MIQVARVDYPNMPKGFDYLSVERIGGIAGVHERVRIEPVEADDAAHAGEQHRRRLAATVHAFVQDPRELLLDAAMAERILELVGPLAAATPVEPPPPPGADLYSWTVDVCWDGNVTRFEVHGVANDAALHGVLEVAAALLAHPEGAVEPSPPV